jgi:phenylalanine-4-hydroxylase
MPHSVLDELFIQQSYELYSREDHATWRRLYTRIEPRWRQWANRRFLEGIDLLGLDAERIPRLDEVNRRLSPLTGFAARAVAGYVPAFVFFDCLRRREFPTTVTIRPGDQLDYLPEPDIFHDIAGHVPMHTDARFAEALAGFGRCAHEAVALGRGIADESERLGSLSSVIQALARFFWFTVEFGLMRENGELRAYGSGLLSSCGELEHSLTSPSVQRYPMQIEWAVNQSFEINHYQPLLFVIDGFDHLFALVEELGAWMRAGRLSHVAPGEPRIERGDLESFFLT